MHHGNIPAHHRRFIASAVIFLFFALTPATAELPVETLQIGGRSGWQDLAFRQNVRLVPGWQGGHDLTLADWSAQAQEETDLLARFDTGVVDEIGNYAVANLRAHQTDRHRRFGSGALALNGDAAVAFFPGPRSLMAAGSQPGSMTIDLWIYPLRVGDGTEVVRWQGAHLEDGRPILQELRLEIFDGRFRWSLDNLIAEAQPDGSRVFASQELSARRGVVPQRWTHHQLRYNAEIGQLSYRVDGIPEAIAYLAPDNREGAALRDLFFGADTGDGLVVGDGFYGFIDEFRISGTTDSEPRLVAYSGDSGRAITGPIELAGPGTRVEDILVRTAEPGRTDTRVWYRVADMVVDSRPETALPGEWRQVPANGVLDATVRGAFLQVRFDLLADATGQNAPRVQELVVHYRPELPPPPPRLIDGTSVPAGVRLSWDPIRQDDIAGYRVYIGERTGRYLGTRGVSSPRDIGPDTTVTIDGLEPDRAYVFALETYDRHGRTSRLSQEIQVRAGRRGE